MVNQVFKKVVIPLDGSAIAQTILDHLPYITLPQETELVLIRSVEAWRYAYHVDGMTDITSYLQESAKVYLKEQSELLKKRGYQVSVYLEQGEAANEILRTAEAVQADLIAMTTHGRSGISRWALGSVAERVLHSSQVPVLLVRQETEIPSAGLGRILVPLDGSKLAEQALPVATAIAQKASAELMLVRVVQTLDETNRHILFANEKEADATFAKYQKRVDKYLVETERQLRLAGVSTTHRALLADPSAGICDSAIEADVDLIVLSTHGRTGLGRWYYGSVASKVIRSVHCPVLLVRSVESDLEQETEATEEGETPSIEREENKSQVPKRSHPATRG